MLVFVGVFVTGKCRITRELRNSSILVFYKEVFKGIVRVFT